MLAASFAIFGMGLALFMVSTIRRMDLIETNVDRLYKWADNVTEEINRKDGE